MTDAFLAAQLLRIGAVHIRPDEPFTWASGWKSPIYCDNRQTLGYPEVRRYIRDRFVAHLDVEVDRVAGTATAGIPHAAWLADALDVPMVYVRGQAKGHGRQSRIEGPLHPGDRVVLIEDLISTGGSSLQAVEALREAGAEVVRVMAIFTYGFPHADEAFARAHVEWDALCSYPTLLDVATRAGQISAAQRDRLQSWSQSPDTWHPDATL